jgi:hypothetical protein
MTIVVTMVIRFPLFLQFSKWAVLTRKCRALTTPPNNDPRPREGSSQRLGDGPNKEGGLIGKTESNFGIQ